MTQFENGVSLILGGARSGKSTFAETLVDQSGLAKKYLATSQAFDGEMKDRIKLHRQRRGTEWQLIEEPSALVEVLQRETSNDSCILVDCLTLWLTNLMIAERNVDAECDVLCQALPDLMKNGANILFVSNEVGQGIVPMEKMARDFRDHAGRLHQKIAATVPHVWFVTAGLSQKLK